MPALCLLHGYLNINHIRRRNHESQGCQRSGKGQAKNIFQVQGKVREGCKNAGKIFEYVKVREKSGNFVMNARDTCFITVLPLYVPHCSAFYGPGASFLIPFECFLGRKCVFFTCFGWDMIPNILVTPANRGTYYFCSDSAAAAVSSAAVLPTLFNFPEKHLKLISSNHTWLTYGCGKNFGTHLSDLGSRSLSYRSGTQFNLSPR